MRYLPVLIRVTAACLAVSVRVQAEPVLDLAQIAAGLDRPVAITHAGDGSNRLFITLQTGRIIIYDGDGILPAPFLDISSLVSCCGERGLLSAAFHPGYRNNGLFFVDYTDKDGNTVVARYHVSEDPNLADPGSAVPILQIEQPFSNHNGGQLQFGPGGYLYIGTGDGGSGGDPGNRAQDLSILLGKILRIDIDGQAPYAIPADNPFAGSTDARNEIWAYGLRNPWRFTFDRLTDDLFIADVGQGSIEEIDFQPAAGTGGENYGWRRMEGSSCFNPSSDCNDGSLVLPIMEYTHAEGCSVTGGYRYRGNVARPLAGVYVFGDYCSGTIWGGVHSGDDWQRVELTDTSLAITAFGEDEAGEMYVTHLGNGTDGAVYRLISAADCNDVTEPGTIQDLCLSDGDEDTIINAEDNCPSVPNPSLTDNDGDKLGDVCDPDDDNDGVDDAIEIASGRNPAVNEAVLLQLINNEESE